MSSIFKSVLRNKVEKQQTRRRRVWIGRGLDEPEGGESHYPPLRYVVVGLDQISLAASMALSSGAMSLEDRLACAARFQIETPSTDCRLA